MFQVEYKYSACIKVITGDVKLLCDPWLLGNAYEGTWKQYPFPVDGFDFIGDFDLIYISHIHPDHYCCESIKKLFERYGPKKLLIADWGQQANYLQRKMVSDGFGSFLLVANNFSVGDTNIQIIPNETGSKSDIDSALIVSSIDTKKALLNINDCVYNERLFASINQFKEQYKIEFCLFCLGFTGAGPYPQTYYSPIHEGEMLMSLAKEKKTQFFDRYLKAINSVESLKRLPFAGKYVLKGDLSVLNKYRGVADPLEVKEFDPGAVVLEDGGDSFFDLETLTASSERSDLYVIPEYINNDDDYKWRKDIGFDPGNTLLTRLLRKSVLNAHAKSECKQNCFWSIYANDLTSNLKSLWDIKEPWESMSPLVTFNCNKISDPFDIEMTPEVHSHLFIERKALFSVLSGISHWNNYEVGSVFQVRRIPDIHVPEMQRYLNFLSVI